MEELFNLDLLKWARGAEAVHKLAAVDFARTAVTQVRQTRSKRATRFIKFSIRVVWGDPYDEITKEGVYTWDGEFDDDDAYALRSTLVAYTRQLDEWMNAKNDLVPKLKAAIRSARSSARSRREEEPQPITGVGSDSEATQELK